MEKTILGKVGTGIKILVVLLTLFMLFMSLFLTYSIFNSIEYDSAAVYDKNIWGIGNKTIPLSRIYSLSYQKEKHSSSKSTYYSWDCRIRYTDEYGTQRSLSFTPKEKYYASRDDFFSLLQTSGKEIEWKVNAASMPRSSGGVVLKSNDGKKLLFKGNSLFNIIGTFICMAVTCVLAWGTFLIFSFLEYDNQALYKKNPFGLKDKTIPLSRIRKVLLRNERYEYKNKVSYNWKCYLYYTDDEGKEENILFAFDDKFAGARSRFFELLKGSYEGIEWKTEDESLENDKK